MKTSRRLWLGFGVQVTLLVVAVGTITGLLFEIGRHNEALRTTRALSAQARDLEISALSFVAGVHEYRLLGNPAIWQSALSAADAVDLGLAGYRQLAETGEQRRLADESAALWSQLRARGVTVATGEPTPVDLENFNRLRTGFEQYLEQRVQADAVASFEATMLAASELIRNTIGVAILLLLVSVAMSLGTARRVAVRVAHTEAELSRRQGELQSTFDAMGDGVAAFDADGRLVQANAALASMHGYAGARDMEQHLDRFAETFELFEPGGRQISVEEWPASRALAGETYENLELRLRRRDTGVERLLSYSARPVTMAGGTRSHAILVVRDITESARAQREFDEQRHLLQSIFDAAPTLIYVKDLAGRFRVANRAVGDLHGSAPDGLLGRTSADLGRVARRQGVSRDDLGRVLVAEESVTDPTTGEVRWFQTVELPLRHAGANGLLLGVATDITERKRSEEARSLSEHRLRLLIEAMPDPVLAVDEEGRIVFASARAEQVFGYALDELVGKPVELLVPEGALERHQAHRREYMKAPEPRGVGAARRELHARRRDGSTVPVEISLSPVSTPDGLFVMCIVRDLTLTKTLEDQLRQAQKMEAVGQLTGGIAHDLNNILTVIIGNAEMVAKTASYAPEIREDLDELLSAATRGSNLIQRLLQFSRRARLALRPLRPGDVLAGLAPMLRRLLPENIDVRFDDSTTPGDIVVGDAGAIEQMIINLCTNARDAMPNGGSIRVHTERTWLDEGYHATHPWVATGAYVAVSVSDNGSGMDETTKRRLFEPFFTTKPASKGTGLGMAMVYGSMKQHNGMVHVYSELGQGSMIRLYFPLASQADAGPATAPRATDHRPPEGGAETILLAEDEPAIRRTTRRALESRGYRVIAAEDGEEALELYRQRRDEISLVISDLVMPKLGGRQLAEALRAEDSRVQVLFTSGYSADTIGGAGEFPAAVSFLQKPWALSDLFARVRELLDSPRDNAHEP